MEVKNSLCVHKAKAKDTQNQTLVQLDTNGKPQLVKDCCTALEYIFFY
jgi:hypothetical protein